MFVVQSYSFYRLTLILEKKKINSSWTEFLLNPKASAEYITVQNQIAFLFSFKTVEFVAHVFSCNPLALYQRKYT